MSIVLICTSPPYNDTARNSETARTNCEICLIYKTHSTGYANEALPLFIAIFKEETFTSYHL